MPNLGLIYVAIINRFKFFFVQLEGYWIGKVSFPDSLSGSQFAIIRQESVLCESQAGRRKKKYTLWRETVIQVGAAAKPDNRIVYINEIACQGEKKAFPPRKSEYVPKEEG